MLTWLSHDLGSPEPLDQHPRVEISSEKGQRVAGARIAVRPNQGPSPTSCSEETQPLHDRQVGLQPLQ
jgi:hypothetical protein